MESVAGFMILCRVGPLSEERGSTRRSRAAATPPEVPLSRGKGHGLGCRPAGPRLRARAGGRGSPPGPRPENRAPAPGPATGRGEGSVGRAPGTRLARAPPEVDWRTLNRAVQASPRGRVRAADAVDECTTARAGPRAPCCAEMPDEVHRSGSRPIGRFQEFCDPFSRSTCPGGQLGGVAAGKGLAHRDRNGPGRAGGRPAAIGRHAAGSPGRGDTTTPQILSAETADPCLPTGDAVAPGENRWGLHECSAGLATSGITDPQDPRPGRGTERVPAGCRRRTARRAVGRICGT